MIFKCVYKPIVCVECTSVLVYVLIKNIYTSCNKYVSGMGVWVGSKTRGTCTPTSCDIFTMFLFFNITSNASDCARGNLNAGVAMNNVFKQLLFTMNLLVILLLHFYIVGSLNSVVRKNTIVNILNGI